MTQQRPSKVVGNGFGNGPSYYVQLAYECNTLLVLRLKREDESEDVTCVDEANDNHISRVWNLPTEDHPANAVLNEFNCRAVQSAAARSRGARGCRERPEVPVMVFENLQVRQAV